MIQRYLIVAALLAVGAFALVHPARTPLVEQAATPMPAPSDAAPRLHRRLGGASAPGDDVVVYVAGAVKRPGLYHLRPGDRNARAVALAGGFDARADAGAVNLAQRPGDGDEVYVPAAGETTAARPRSSHHSTRRRRASPPPASVDVNVADASQLAAVPGIGPAIAERIVELRRREGNFASLDELLDVAGMTSSRLDRARPFLRDL